MDRQIALVIMDGNCCVAHWAMDGIRQGYEIGIPARYIGIRNQKRFKKTRERFEDAGVTVSQVIRKGLESCRKHY